MLNCIIMTVDKILEGNAELPWIPSALPHAYGDNISNEDALRGILLQLSTAHIENNGLHKNDNLIQALNNYLQYYQNELNYERSTPEFISNMLQKMGMSRSAALQAAAGAQSAAGAIQPSAPAPNMQLSELTQGAASLVGAATGVGNLYATLSALPFDNRVKAATADILGTQNTALNEQKQGMALASAAIQTCSNMGFDFEGANATSVMDYMRGVPEFGSLVKSISDNPYAFAALSDMCTKEYATKAESFSPQFAEHRASQQRSLAALTANDVANIPFQNTLLANQAYRDEVATAYFQAVEYARTKSAIAQEDVNYERAKNIKEHIRLFNEADLQILTAQLNQAKAFNDSKVQKEYLESVYQSTRFQAAQALHAFQLTDLANNVFIGENRDNRTNLVSTAKNYLYGVELGSYQESSNIRSWITAGATTVGSIAACLLAGSKIFGAKTIVPPSMYQGWTPSFSPTGASLVY